MLTWQGWLITLFCLFLILFLFVRNIHSFLAVNDRVDADILIVEGWLNELTLEQAINEFRATGYERIITIGGPILKGSFLSEYKNNAELTTACLISLGVDKDSIISLPVKKVLKDRTYNCALGLKKWISDTDLNIESANVFTYGSHARRTRLLYCKACGDDLEIGVIAAENPYYDPDRWWISSSGVRSVISDFIAYIYARLFFHPEM